MENSINPQIVMDIDENSPMSDEECRRLVELEKTIKDNWLDDEIHAYEMGKVLSEIKEESYWKKEEFFRIKTGKNKGKFVKNPSFDKWMKVNRESLGSGEYRDYKKYLNTYEGAQRRMKYHAEQLAKLEQMDKFSRRYDEGGQSDL